MDDRIDVAVTALLANDFLGVRLANIFLSFFSGAGDFSITQRCFQMLDLPELRSELERRVAAPQKPGVFAKIHYAKDRFFARKGLSRELRREAISKFMDLGLVETRQTTWSEEGCNLNFNFLQLTSFGEEVICSLAPEGKTQKVQFL